MDELTTLAAELMQLQRMHLTIQSLQDGHLPLPPLKVPHELNIPDDLDELAQLETTPEMTYLDLERAISDWTEQERANYRINLLAPLHRQVNSRTVAIARKLHTLTGTLLGLPTTQVPHA